MENTGELYFQQGAAFFQAEQYEDAIKNLVQAYDLGYKKEQILEDIYNCFILPNEREFRENYARGSAEFTRLPFEACTLDFIPVSEKLFYIFDRKKRAFLRAFELAESPVCGEEQTDDSILYVGEWDIRKMLPDMKRHQRASIYLLPGEREAEFASFFKLPRFKELYLENVILFKSESIMLQFFEEFSGAALPREIVSNNQKRYWNLMLELYSKRISGFIAEERPKILFGDVTEPEKANEAYLAAKQAVRRNPYDFMANRKARILCAYIGCYDEAFRYDTVLDFLQGKFSEISPVTVWAQDLMGMIYAQYYFALVQGDEISAEKYRKNIGYLKRHGKVVFGLDDHTYSRSPIVSTIYEDAFGNRWYNARFEAIGFVDILPDVESGFDNCVLTKLECLQVTKTNVFAVDDKAEYLLPVLQEEADETFKISTSEGKEYICKNKKAKHFEYYRLPPMTKLEAKAALYLGKPIALRQDPAKKKLVLNIFVDGLSQKVMEEESLAKLMPCTDKFFSKGVYCTNVYTAGEWTLPSLASYFTGVSTRRHMLIHNEITNTLPEDVTVLSEYFKEQGYHTAKIDGDWRSNLPYGYGRGMDRVIYQYQDTGLKAAQVVADVLDHIELMKETNQFIWMCVGDLHHIADGYALSASTQASLALENRCAEEVGVTSVKQRYSEQKRAEYMAQMKYIDRCLEPLYDYLEEQYKEDEVIISMFGDHGQGYLVHEKQHFLSEGRSKVGMMFRGGFEKKTVCDELISTCDYLSIMCKLAGIPLKDEDIDGKLPVFFGGGKGREYVITESIHLGDPYYAAIVSKDCAFYFTSGGCVSYDGRFEMGDYQCQLFDKEGRELFDKERGEYYMDILMRHIDNLVI